MNKLAPQNSYKNLLLEIKNTFNDGKATSIKMVRRQMVLTYWGIGRHIVEFEQMGNEKAVYGSKILGRLKDDLSDQLGKGFSRTNLIYMRLIYIKFPNINSLSDQLTWGHLVELLTIDHDLERS